MSEALNNLHVPAGHSSTRGRVLHAGAAGSRATRPGELLPHRGGDDALWRPRSHRAPEFGSWQQPHDWKDVVRIAASATAIGAAAVIIMLRGSGVI